MNTRTFNPMPSTSDSMPPVAKTWVANLLEMIFGNAKAYELQEEQ